MRRKKPRSKRYNFFWVLLPLVVVFAGGVLLLSSQRYLSQNEVPCGCGPLAVDPSGEFDAAESQAYFDNQPVAYPLAELSPETIAQRPSEKSVLGVADDNRWLEVDLSDQKLYAHNGPNIDLEFPISSGKQWTPTVKGEFRIWVKIKYAKMSGGSKENGTYYYLPNVPYIQYFYKDYGLHGAYWHNNFGHPMSHGCVNLSVLDAEKLFGWTSPTLPSGKNTVFSSKDDPGTRVVVHD